MLMRSALTTAWLEILLLLLRSIQAVEKKSHVYLSWHEPVRMAQKN